MWGWRDEPAKPGPVICVDIDGVLADARHRLHHLQGRMRDYDSFFLASADDDLLATQAVMIDAFGPEYTIAMVTSRPAWIGGLTVEWLETHHVRWDLIIMRSNMDYRQAPLVKAEAMAQLRHVGFEPKLAFDDDARNVAAYADLGIPCVYIHSGYHS